MTSPWRFGIILHTIINTLVNSPTQVLRSAFKPGSAVNSPRQADEKNDKNEKTNTSELLHQASCEAAPCTHNTKNKHATTASMKKQPCAYTPTSESDFVKKKEKKAIPDNNQGVRDAMFVALCVTFAVSVCMMLTLSPKPKVGPTSLSVLPVTAIVVLLALAPWALAKYLTPQERPQLSSTANAPQKAMRRPPREPWWDPPSSTSSTSSTSSASSALSPPLRARRHQRAGRNTKIRDTTIRDTTIRFGDVTVQEYEIEVGGSGMTITGGPPLGLGWHVVKKQCASVNEFEASRRYTRNPREIFIQKGWVSAEERERRVIAAGNPAHLIKRATEAHDARRQLRLQSNEPAPPQMYRRQRVRLRARGTLMLSGGAVSNKRVRAAKRRAYARRTSAEWAV